VEREDWNRRHRERGGLVHGGGPDPTVVAVASGMAPGSALELGCGQGRNAIWLAEQGWRVAGVDFSDVALATARERAGDLPAEWIEADLREYEPAEQAFDLVVYPFVQLPAGERGPVLRKAAAAVAPGGTLLAVVHDPANLTEGCGGPSNPAVLATPEDLAADLPGLTIERAERFYRPVTTADGEQAQQVDAVVVARR
jgi:SAM-dependent methyltransferase